MSRQGKFASFRVIGLVMVSAGLGVVPVPARCGEPFMLLPPGRMPAPWADPWQPAAEQGRVEPGPSDIFVPAPRGAGETLDGDSQPAAEAADTVATKRGDRLVGHVVGIGEDGRLRLTGPQFEGEVKVLLADLSSVALVPSPTASGQDELTISNGDRIVGEISAISPDTVVINSNAAGAIKVSRKVINTIGFGKASGHLVDSSFDRGTMEPWRATRGNWTISDGQLTCHTSGSNYTVSAPLKQDGPLTMEAAVESLRGNSLCVTLALCADNTSGSHGRNSVFCMFYGSEYYVGYSQNGSTNHVVNRNLGRSIRGKAVLRLAFTPQTQKAKIWLNSDLLGEYAVAGAPKSGKHVLLSTQYACRLKYIRVTSGVSGPGEATAAGEDETDTVQFSNGDRLSTKSVSLTDGQFVARTSYGELKCPVENVKGLVFRKKGRERPRRQKGDVLVQTRTSCLTVRLQSLDEGSLLGASNYLGKVTIKRSAIRTIKFNIYQ